MKTLFLSAFLTLNIASASTFTCDWLDTGFDKGFYRPAHFNVDFNQEKILITNDNFFIREYQPCWVGEYAKCSFSFELGQEIHIDRERSNLREINASFTSLDEYGAGSLSFNFEKKVDSLKRHEQVIMTLDGDDGDGTLLNKHQFACVLN